MPIWPQLRLVRRPASKPSLNERSVMRIAILQAGFGAGGAEKNVALLARHRAAIGDEVHVIAMTCPQEGSYFSYPDEVTLHVLEQDDTGSSRLTQVRRLFLIRTALRSLNPDMAISFLTKINVLTLAASIGAPWPVVVSERNNPKKQRNNPLWRVLNDITGRRADRIVMQTRRALEDLPRNLQGRAVVVHNPFLPIEAAEHIEENGQRVVAVGRLDHQKGFDMLIEAFALVAAQTPRARLTIFGEGGERSSLEALVREKGLEDVVSLPGTTRRPGEWIGQGDVFVLSSRHEGFANVLIEATCAGLPAIAFDCDYSPSEIISHMENGLLVPPDDVPELAQAISTLLADETLQGRFRAAAEINRERFGHEKIMRDWDDVISQANGRA